MSQSTNAADSYLHKLIHLISGFVIRSHKVIKCLTFVTKLIIFVKYPTISAQPDRGGTGVPPVLIHGRDAHGTSEGITGILPATIHGQDAHGAINGTYSILSF